MIEVRIAYYFTCDSCGELGRSEVSAAVAAPWLNPPCFPPHGWIARTIMGPRGKAEQHLCPACTAKAQGKANAAKPALAAVPPDPPEAKVTAPASAPADFPPEATEAAAGLAALSKPGERS